MSEQRDISYISSIWIPKYECPKHGVVEHAITFKEINPAVDGTYCTVCIAELFKLLCCQVKPIVPPASGLK